MDGALRRAFAGSFAKKSWLGVVSAIQDRKLSGERSLSDKRRYGAIADARGERTGKNVSLRRFSTAATSTPP